MNARSKEYEPYIVVMPCASSMTAYRRQGEVVLSHASDEPSPNPVVTNFLTFLERYLQAHPENIRPVAAGTFAEAKRLTSGIEVDLDKALPEDDDDA